VKNGARIIGLEDLQETLLQVMPREAKNILRRTTYQLATKVRDGVKAKAPVHTGNLKRSIKAKRDRGTKTNIAASVIADRGGGRSGKGYHSHFLEFGTVKMQAQPFIVPTVEAMRPEVTEMYRTEFGVQFEREMAKRHKKRK
jgi:HK97 gp10 family phage protein